MLHNYAQVSEKLYAPRVLNFDFNRKIIEEIKKILESSVIPKENFYVSVYEDELKDVADKYGVNVFHRSETSAKNDNSLQTIYEWHDKLPSQYKYVILVSACNPLLKTETIDGFFQAYIEQEERGLMAVIDKRNYFWNDKGSMVTPWPEGQTIMNTKAVAPTYEAAHTMYGSRLDTIKDNIFRVSVSVFSPTRIRQKFLRKKRSHSLNIHEKHTFSQKKVSFLRILRK